jgi:hypothetical protein
MRELRKLDIFEFFSYLENYDNGRRKVKNNSRH